jgi:hypothetical protein
MLDTWTSLVLVSRPGEDLAVPGVHLDDQTTLTAPLVPLVEDFPLHAAEVPIPDGRAGNAAKMSRGWTSVSAADGPVSLSKSSPGGGFLLSFVACLQQNARARSSCRGTRKAGLARLSPRTPMLPWNASPKLRVMASRFPPGLSRCRRTLPEEAGIGATPHRCARAASLRSRSG